MGVVTWPEEAENIVRQYFAAETATKIADRLAEAGMPFSRSAIIGKASRLGLYLPRRGTGHRRPRGPDRKPRAPRRKKTNVHGWNSQFGNPVSDKPTAPVFLDLPAEQGAVTLLDLERHHCRYTADGLTFCGDEIERLSYCSRHAARCYTCEAA